MTVGLITSEAVPFSKTGGLADVVGALFREYLKLGLAVYLFVPLYRVTRQQCGKYIRDTGLAFDVDIGKETVQCRVFVAKVAPSGEIIAVSGEGTEREPGSVFLIGSDGFFDRDDLYGTATGEFGDNDRRFAFFCKAVLETCRRLGLSPDVVHCHDWETALIPLFLKTLCRNDPGFAKTRSVLTIHKLGYQGVFPALSMEVTGLPWDLFRPEGVEFYGKVNYLKAGLIAADILTTVSVTYAKEIVTPEFGFGLDGVLRKRADVLVGIVDGIDYSEWDPSSDTRIPHIFTADDLSGKAQCRRGLIKQCALKGKLHSPVLAFVGRLAGQKGIDILIEVMSDAVRSGALCVIVGTGEQRFHDRLNALAARFPGKVHFHGVFDEILAHLVYAGSDIFLMPSLYEPCGLGQMIAMRYGTIPVARMTGGSADTISHVTHVEHYLCGDLFGEAKGTGFLFKEYSAESFSAQLHRALCLYRSKEAWSRLIRNAMSSDFSWELSAQKYLQLYAGQVP
jgi:starch synthase